MFRGSNLNEGKAEGQGGPKNVVYFLQQNVIFTV